ncbi:MAG: fumarylacetoacetate hydrolase family protein [Pseudomonadota bacterium]
MSARFEEIARNTLAAIDAGRSMSPPSLIDGALDFDDAYLVASHMTNARLARGEKVLGKKIGFTNKATWKQLGMKSAVWAPIYDATIAELTAEPFALSGFNEPRIEPEIILGFDNQLNPQCTLSDIEEAVAWVSLGFEIVQSIYPGWNFATSDAVVNQGMHGELLVGKKVALNATNRKGLAATLSAMEVSLLRGGETVAKGSGKDVLGGPVQAIAHLLQLPGSNAIDAGDIVTTGTLTPVLPVMPGENWRVDINENNFNIHSPEIRFC